MSQVPLETVGAGILESLASGTCWDVPSSPRYSWDHRNWDLASGTCWDVPSSLRYSYSWDHWDWDC